MSRLSLPAGIALAALGLAFVHPAQAQTSIQFKGQGTVLTSGQLAGVIPTTHYNVLSGLSGTSGFLLDNAGNGTLIKASFSAPTNYNSSSGTGTANGTLMSGYLDSKETGSNPTVITDPSVTVSGLDPTKSYSVYAYFNTDHVGSSAGQSDRIAQYTIGSTTFTANLQPGKAFDASAANGGFIAAVGSSTTSANVANYALFSNVKGSSFTLTTKSLSSADPYPRSPINGLQIFVNGASAAP